MDSDIRPQSQSSHSGSTVSAGRLARVAGEGDRLCTYGWGQRAGVWVRKVVQAVGEKVRVPPSRSFESRTRT